MTAGSFLRETREAASLTQSQLAERAFTRQSVISRYEQGHVSPTVRQVEHLLRSMGCVLHMEARRV